MTVTAPLHVILVAIGTAGDVYPMVGLGAALRRRGHSATLLANEFFEPVARRAGLRFAAHGDRKTYEALIERPELYAGKGEGARLIFDHAFIPAVRPIYEA